MPRSFAVKSSAAILVCYLIAASSAKDEPRPKTVAEALEHAAKISQLTHPGSAPFHLKATVAELNSPDSDYKAEIEEYWVAPDKWRRTIKAPDFSQTKIVNGPQVSEQNQGAYYPFWLRNFVTAIFDLAPTEIMQTKSPLPDITALQEQIAKKLPQGLSGLRFDTGSSCSRITQSVGISPVHNSIFTNICFQNPPGLLTSVISPTFHADFADFKKFKDKQVARKISNNPEPGTKIEANITELTELKNPDPAMFTVQSSTPIHERITATQVSEEVARGQLQSSPDIAWQPVRDGKLTGTLSLLVMVDKEGHVRETWPLNSDNPFPEDQARQAVGEWKFKPMVLDGVPVQMETILTFAFQTRLGNAIPLLPDAEARKLAMQTAEPEFILTKKPPSGTEFTVRAAVGEDGTVIGVKNVNNVDATLFMAANGALHKWKFRPYFNNGKPDRFDADITFRVQ
jgi:outer membrane biosynthesis protein TonB